MFERFSDPARRVVVLAQEEARELDHQRVGTEHMLLGLLGEADSLAGRALGSLGIEPVTVRQQVMEGVGRGDSPSPRRIPFSARAKKVLELSLREALALDHEYIGTEHILLGIVREGEGLAAKILVGLGVDLSNLRARVLELLAAEEAKPARGRPHLRIRWRRRQASETPADESGDHSGDESG
jgi:ATP-dependent Clp protease ATP-binding subunit ClpC